MSRSPRKLSDIRLLDFVNGLKAHKLTSEEACHSDGTVTIRSQIDLELLRTFQPHQETRDLDILIVPKISAIEGIDENSLEILLTHENKSIRAIGLFLQQLNPSDEPPFKLST